MKQKNKNLRKKMKRLITKWEHSEMSLRSFSKIELISYEKLRYWKRKFNMIDQASNQELTNPPKNISDFISIEVPNKASDFTDLQLTYPNNIRLSFPSGITIYELKTLIKLF